MDLRMALDMALGVVSFLGAWFVKVIFERIERLEQALRDDAKDLANLRVAMATDYTSKDDFKAQFEAIFGALLRIEEKLDRKVDKG